MFNKHLVACSSFAVSMLVALPAYAGCCHGAGKDPIMFVVGLLVWFALATYLLFYTWNTVLAPVFSFKKVKPIQALLVLVTLTVLCAPKHFMGHHMGCNKMGCHHEKGHKMDKNDGADATMPMENDNG